MRKRALEPPEGSCEAAVVITVTGLALASKQRINANRTSLPCLTHRSMPSPQ